MIALSASLATIAAGYALGVDWLYWAGIAALVLQFITNKRGGSQASPIAKKTHKP